MSIICEVEGESKQIKCPNFRNSRGFPDFLAIRKYLREQGIDHRGHLKVA